MNTKNVETQMITGRQMRQIIRDHAAYRGCARWRITKGGEVQYWGKWDNDGREACGWHFIGSNPESVARSIRTRVLLPTPR